MKAILMMLAPMFMKHLLPIIMEMFINYLANKAKESSNDLDDKLVEQIAVIAEEFKKVNK